LKNSSFFYFWARRYENKIAMKAWNMVEDFEKGLNEIYKLPKLIETLEKDCCLLLEDEIDWYEFKTLLLLIAEIKPVENLVVLFRFETDEIDGKSVIYPLSGTVVAYNCETKEYRFFHDFEAFIEYKLGENFAEKLINKFGNRVEINEQIERFLSEISDAIVDKIEKDGIEKILSEL